MMKIIVHTAKSQTLFSILSLNATTLKLFMLKLLIGLMQNSTALFLQRLMKYYSEQISILQGIMSLNLINVYYLPNYYLHYQKMFSKACNTTEFVLKLEQKLLIESRLKRKIFCVKMLLPSTRLLSDLVFFCNAYYTLFCRALCSTTLFFVLS